MAKVSFEAELEPAGRGGHWVTVPDDVVQKLGGKGRTPVRANFNGVPYRGSVVKMGGAFRLGVLQDVMTQANVRAGDTLSVEVENDDAPREVEVPHDLAKAIAKTNLTNLWEEMSFSHRKEYARAVDEAKKPETRTKRIDQAIAELRRRAESKH